MRLILAVLAVIASTACSSKSPSAQLPKLRPSPTPAATATPMPTGTRVIRSTPALAASSSYPITTVNLDETVTVGDLVLNVAEIPATAVSSAPQPGRQWVLLTLMMQNIGEQLVSINTARDLMLKDSANRFYKIALPAVAAIRGTAPDVDLAPGETVRAQLGFDVPAEARELVLSFAADKFKAGRIFITLPTAAPVALSSPTATTDTPTATLIVLSAAPIFTAIATPTATAQPASANVVVALLDPSDTDALSGRILFR